MLTVGRKTILSSAQLEWYKNDVNDKSMKVARGLQCILTNDRYVIPINMRDGLPYVSLCLYADEEWEILLHIILTSDVDWDPSVLDHDLDDHETWFDVISDLPSAPPHTMFDELGDYCRDTWLSKSLFMMPSVIGLMSVVLLVTVKWFTLTRSTPRLVIFISTCF